MVNQLLIWMGVLTPIVWEAITDYRDSQKEKKDRKVQDVMYRALWYTAVGLLFHATGIMEQSFWQFALLGLGLYVMVFDYIMGYLLKKNIFYVGTTSKLDQLWGFVPPWGSVIIRGIIFASTVTAFYDLDKIIYGN
jgi:hypothetical protein